MKRIDDKIDLANIKTLIETQGLFGPFEKWIRESYQELMDKLLKCPDEDVLKFRYEAKTLKAMLDDIETIRNLDLRNNETL